MRRLFLTLILAASSIVASAQWYANTTPRVSANASLEGRGTEGSLPRPGYNVQESGTMVVTIWVDNYGKVVKAQAGADGTTITDKALWDATRDAAMGTRFKQKMDAPAMQEGTIRYVFRVDSGTASSSINNGALKFLGIPIDGPEAQFAYKLRNKGFEYNPVKECYEGQFNGHDVDVYLHSNHNLVDRVYVSFPYTNENGIRTEYNRLLSQFNDNVKYLDLVMNKRIPEDDDISYEITVKNKRYQAVFCYFDPDRDSIAFMNEVMDLFSDYFTEEQLAKLKEYSEKLMDTPEDQKEALQTEMMTEMQKMGVGQEENADPDPEKAFKFLAAFLDGMRSLADGEVWFMIHENYGRYQIGLYYDNLHNRPHGEDL